MKMINNIKCAAAAVALTLGQACGSFSASAQSYSNVYDALPDMTLDQAYSVLLEFQRANPYVGNVYAQIGSVSEKKMLHFDPLRDNASVRFWAGNANLFYGNLKVYYKSGDVRSEFYENLHIPMAGKKLEDSDFWNFIEQRKTVCKNYSDTTSMIYAAIEKSKFYYNKCIADYISISQDYLDIYELLLRNDAGVNARLHTIGESIDNCIKEFDEYKRLTGLYPVMNYNQFYEKKKIETYRLDGVTNSDFYQNRFFIWDFRAWLDEYYKVFNDDIIPLRREVQRINDDYLRGREEFEKGGAQDVVLAQPYDEFFFYRLCRYDNESIVRDLFNYLDETRQLVVMAGDSIGRNIPTDQDLTLRKMRHIYRMCARENDLADSRAALDKIIKADKIAHFADFFSKNYGGEAGLHKFLADEPAFCASLISATANAIGAYVADLAAARRTVSDVYSAKKGSVPALPLWVADDVKALSGNYQTTITALGSRGNVSYVAGVLKNNSRSWFLGGVSDAAVSEWVLPLKNVNAVNAVQAVTGGCLVSAVRKLAPAIIHVDNTGKELCTVALSDEAVELMDYDDVSGRIRWVSGNEKQQPMLSLTDSLGVKQWTMPILGLSRALSVEKVSGGFLVSGLNADDALATVFISDNGDAADANILLADVEALPVVARASAGEIALLARKKDGNCQYIIISQKGERFR